jgi:hypothetical protein
MLDLTPGGIAPVLQPCTATIAVREVLREPTGEPKLVLRSRIPGRERWYVDRIEDKPLLAAAVELVLRSEEGIEAVQANPLTGRVLVRYRPDSLSASVETLLRRAVAAGPMTQEEFATLRAEQQPCSFSKPLVTLEIAHFLSHLLLFHPLGLAATSVLLVLHGNRAHA